MPLGVLLDTFERPTMRWLLAIKATTTTWWCFAWGWCALVWYGVMLVGGGGFSPFAHCVLC